MISFRLCIFVRNTTEVILYDTHFLEKAITRYTVVWGFQEVPSDGPSLFFEEMI